MNALQAVIARRELLYNLVMRDLKSRYKGSVLGFLWTVLTPLFMAVIYVLFLRMLGRGVPVEDIIIGVFAWQFTMQTVNAGMMSVTGNGNLVKKVQFPLVILPASSVVSSLVNFLLSLAVQFVLLAVLLAVKGASLSVWAVAVPAVILLHVLFNLGLALLLSSLNVYFRDTQHLVGVLVNAWFFVSPVMYDLSFVDRVAGAHTWIPKLYMLNPIAVIVTAYRALTLGEPFPWSAAAAVSVAASVVFLVLSYVLFKRLSRFFADMI